MKRSTTRLSDAALHQLLQECPEWTLREGMLVREWSFPSFGKAIEFVHQVASLAEAADHHPDIDIRYTRVTLALISHDVDGLTARDAAMVRQLSERFPGSSA